VSERFTLISGRTRKQAIGMHKGKDSPEYHAATEIVEMNPDDMVRLGIAEGGRATLRTEAGEVALTAHEGALPAGLVFVPMGTAINGVIGTQTFNTGMPSFKGLSVEVEPAAAPPAGAEGGGS
jgi:formylmethanofuran dehydrogenase subunit D